jgi:hypothetical protein
MPGFAGRGQAFFVSTQTFFLVNLKLGIKGTLDSWSREF